MSLECKRCGRPATHHSIDGIDSDVVCSEWPNCERTTDPVADLCELIWLEYMVATEAFDRTLPGAASPSTGAWIVTDMAALRQSIEHARTLHARALAALSKVLHGAGRRFTFDEEVVRVQRIYAMGPEARARLLGDRSPIHEVLGPAVGRDASEEGQQYRPECAEAPGFLAEGLGAISRR